MLLGEYLLCFLALLIFARDDPLCIPSACLHERRRQYSRDQLVAFVCHDLNLPTRTNRNSKDTLSSPSPPIFQHASVQELDCQARRENSGRGPHGVCGGLKELFLYREHRCNGPSKPCGHPLQRRCCKQRQQHAQRFCCGGRLSRKWRGCFDGHRGCWGQG